MAKDKKKVVLVKDKEDGVIFKHPIKHAFKGASKPYGCGKSKTALRLTSFGKLVGAFLSERDDNLRKNIVAAYGKGIFIRGDFDAGTLSRLGERGMIEHIEGDKTSLNAKFRLTAQGLLGTAAA